MGCATIKIISVVGKKNTGKTSLTVKIIEELKNRRFKVASIKHSHHKMEMDKKDTDTWKHKQAGSEIVVGIGSSTFFNISKNLPLERILFLIKIIEEPDFVVIEGFKDYSYCKISTSPEINDEFVLETVNALKLPDSEIAPLVDKIEKSSYDILDTLYTTECGLDNSKDIGKAIIKNEITNNDTEKEVYLSINEKIVGVNCFVNDFIKNTVIGMLDSLKTEEYGIKDFQKIEVMIKNKENRKN
ncbi:molybdopterin-guanine dinucleotide biosynthesis adapter protein [Methanobrevibacter cuticularis]|uniref:Molybdopterin-guanine dinucleotide biosynthesis adapter protein n=1 Tax=Methanobrevibacter cuticularis TaxID=47311 RepID=A0A166DF40_9EURY|nr:molybdopterin-guanine dinucleotide biosynthesis protein B [Methanobrevibacter cuticularis]KZX15530.1 molybdopterin-guanine dinucleotide biosynthesis adapter protein [Methanobrevibacter cuticularis]